MYLFFYVESLMEMFIYPWFGLIGHNHYLSYSRLCQNISMLLNVTKMSLLLLLILNPLKAKFTQK